VDGRPCPTDTDSTRDRIGVFLTLEGRTGYQEPHVYSIQNRACRGTDRGNDVNNLERTGARQEGTTASQTNPMLGTALAMCVRRAQLFDQCWNPCLQ
jgi:hypothetical protein